MGAIGGTIAVKRRGLAHELAPALALVAYFVTEESFLPDIAADAPAG
jgi:hypothetical protein